VSGPQDGDVGSTWRTSHNTHDTT